MSEQHCPNCRVAGLPSNSACPQCGWLPLRRSEMQFVDDQQVTCPKCSVTRPIAAPTCPSCGTREVLDSPSEKTLNFHISSIFLLTTIVAICVALFQVQSPVGGDSGLGCSVFLRFVWGCWSVNANATDIQ